MPCAPGSEEIDADAKTSVIEYFDAPCGLPQVQSRAVYAGWISTMRVSTWDRYTIVPMISRIPVEYPVLYGVDVSQRPERSVSAGAIQRRCSHRARSRYQRQLKNRSARGHCVATAFDWHSEVWQHGRIPFRLDRA